MTPIEDDPAIWSGIGKLFRPIADSLSFAVPYLAPAAVGALAGVIWKRRRKGVVRALRVLFVSIVVGGMFTPVVAHYLQLPESVSYSAACLFAFFSNEVLNLCAEHIDRHRKWNGVERRGKERRDRE